MVVNLAQTALQPSGVLNFAWDTALALAISNGSNSVYVPPGVWPIKTRTITTGITVRGEEGLSYLVYDDDTAASAAGITIDYTADATASFVPVSFTDAATFPDQTAAPAKTAYRDLSCAIVVPAGLISLCQQDDAIMLYSLSSQPYGYDLGGTKEYLGETMIVDRVDSGTNTIWTRGRPQLAALFAAESMANLKIRRLSRQVFKWDGVGIRSSASPQGHFASGRRSPAMTMQSVVDFSVRNMEIDSSYSSGFRIMGCSQGRFSNIHIKNLVNIPSNGGYGYGFDVYGASSFISVDGAEIFRGRHAVTTNTLDDVTGNVQLDSKFYWIGYPTNCSFKNFTVFGDEGDSIDSHQAGLGLLFEGWDIFHPQENSYAKLSNGSAYTTPSSTIVGKAIQIRTLGTTCRNIRAWGGSQSINIIVYDDERNPLLIADPRSTIIIADSQFQLSPDNAKPHITLSRLYIENVGRIIIKNCIFSNGTMIIDGNDVHDKCDIVFDSNVFMTAATDAIAYCFDLFAGKVTLTNNRFDMRYCGTSVVPMRLRGSVQAILLNNFVEWPGNKVPLINGIVKSEQAAASISQVKLSGANTGNGTCVLDATTPLLLGVRPGLYAVRFTAATTWSVTEPGGAVIASGTSLPATIANGIKFVLTAGGTPFVNGDGFDITVGTCVTAPKSGQVGNGTIAMDATTPVLTGVKDGIYVVTFTSATAFNVTRPTLQNLTPGAVGSGTVGVAFSTEVKFTITAGGTPFAVNDSFTIQVCSGVVLTHANNFTNRPNQITQLMVAGSTGVKTAMTALA